jgi:hypothetical protein
MGLAGTAAKLLASLDLDTKGFERGASRVEGRLGKMQGAFGKIGRAAAIGVGAAVGIGAAIIGRNVKAGLESLADLEDAVTSVGGAIDQKGLTGVLDPQQIATWANQIESNIEAAFDDKDIIRATSTLIRYGDLAPEAVKPAMEVMTDLAARTGSVDSAADKLSKSLADPTKATRLLREAGVALTKAQSDQIKKLTESGKKAEAQALILELVAENTEGAAKASAGPYRDSLNILRDTVEDAQRALAVGFLPVITKVRDILTRELGKPETLERLKGLGTSLAGGLEKVIDFATGLPWQQIGDAFKIMGTGSKALFDAFTSLPPWVQTAVLTAWGTNKITGGLVTELGKGLIKGVLGMTAGVVNAKAGVVNVQGAVAPGARAGAGGGTVVAGGGLGLLGKVFLVGEAIGLVAAVEAVRQSVLEGNRKQAVEVHTTLSESLKSPQTASDIQTKLGAIDKGLRDLGQDPFKDDIPLLADLVAGPTIRELQAMRAEVIDNFEAQNKTTTAVETMRGNMVQALQRDTDRTVSASERIKGAVDWNRQATTSRLDQVVGAIRTGFGGMRITVPVYINGVRQTNLQQRTFLNRVGRNAQL